MCFRYVDYELKCRLKYELEYYSADSIQWVSNITIDYELWLKVSELQAADAWRPIAGSEVLLPVGLCVFLAFLHSEGRAI